jgi:hypothetical protein
MSIEKINQGDQLCQSADLVNDNIDKLKMLFPEIIKKMLLAESPGNSFNTLNS